METVQGITLHLAKVSRGSPFFWKLGLRLGSRSCIGNPRCLQGALSSFLAVEPHVC